MPPKPKQPPASLKGKVTALQPYQLTLPYMRNNYVYLMFLAVYVLVNALLFGTRIYQYRNSNIYTILARACGKFILPVLSQIGFFGGKNTVIKRFSRDWNLKVFQLKLQIRQIIENVSSGTSISV